MFALPISIGFQTFSGPEDWRNLDAGSTRALIAFAFCPPGRKNIPCPIAKSGKEEIQKTDIKSKQPFLMRTTLENDSQKDGLVQGDLFLSNLETIFRCMYQLLVESALRGSVSAIHWPEFIHWDA